MSTVIVGVDPGIVHTGVVGVSFDKAHKRIGRNCLVVDGLDMQSVAYAVEPADLVVVEKYRPRSNFGQDPDMLKAEGELKKLLPKAVMLDNTGITKVVPTAVLQTLGLWDFPVSTHHQDLRSAARIAVKAMMQVDEYNKLLADVVKARIDGEPWTIEDWA